MSKKISTDEVYRMLKRKIIELEYEPGEVLNEVDLAEEFNISRTPIRKVFQQLNADNLLNIVPRFGAQVAPIDFMYMKSVFEVTRILDPFAARLAVDRITAEQIEELESIIERLNTYDINVDYQKAIIDDQKFHDIIFLSSGNACLQEILPDLHNHTERLWHYSKRFFDSMDLFTDSLSKTLNAIKAKDKDDVEKYARDHIDAFVDKIRQELL